MCDVERKMFDVERYVMCTCTCIQPPLESLNTEYKLPVYMSVRDWKGGFTRTEVKDSIRISTSSAVKVQCGPDVCDTITYGLKCGYHGNNK